MRQTRPEGPARLRRIIRTSPAIESLLTRGPGLGLPDGQICAGGIAQTVWNAATDRPPAYGIADLDIVYHDPDDLSEAGESDVLRRVAGVFGDVPFRLDVKNEARVHLWYEAKFGKTIPPYCSVAEAIASFPTTATAVGIALDGSETVTAPFGLDDLFGLVVRPNKRQVDRPVYEAKVARWRRLWPEVTYLPWQTPD